VRTHRFVPEARDLSNNISGDRQPAYLRRPDRGLPIGTPRPDLITRVLDGKINPGKVFDLVLPLEQVAEGYRAMDERRAIKTLLRP
jgi:hypothetical protein